MGCLCVHGHFYQPPRENPWTGLVEEQPSAEPWHDWNERIATECYAPNSWAGIFDPEGWLREVVNNYARMSFDFGPTLMRWLESHAPRVYRAVLEGDREARKRFSGHGSAMAHPWAHVILPLAARQDKEVLIRWGVKDFQYRFDRKPEGMWLPECAVDLESLDIMASVGVSFVVLSPRQALRVRGRDGVWREVNGGIDPFQAYRVALPSGRQMAAFFFHEGLSGEVSFGDLLKDGRRLAQRLMEVVPAKGLLHLATDGETFGHHKPFGELALAHVLKEVEGLLTVYGEYLERHPPEVQVEIAENTSWSCPHGLRRWMEDCGCGTGGLPGWNRAWRRPLRAAMEWLRERLWDGYMGEAEKAFQDPLKAREEYVEVLLDPSRRQTFLSRHVRGPLTSRERARALSLLEMEHQALLMFTSCGWFFDDPSGLETIQVLKHAARAIDLARRALGVELEDGFLERLKEVRSNLPEVGDGRSIYERMVSPCRVDLRRAAACLAVTSLIEGEGVQFGTFRGRERGRRSLEAGEAKLVQGSISVTDGVTEERGDFSFSVLHLGGHNLVGGIGEGEPSGVDLEEVFRRGDLAGVASAIRGGYPFVFTLASLPKDLQRGVLRAVLPREISRISSLLEAIYEGEAPLVSFLRGLDFPLPRELKASALVTLQRKAEEAVEVRDHEGVKAVLEEAKGLGLSVDLAKLRHKLRLDLEGLVEALVERPSEGVISALAQGIEVARVLGDVPLGRVRAGVWVAAQKHKANGLGEAFLSLAQLMKVRMA